MKDQEEEICARDQNLAEERRLKEKFKKEAQDAEARYVRVVEHMTKDLESRDNLEAELRACRAHLLTLSIQLSVSEAAKEKAESAREADVVERLKSEELSEGRYKKLRRKYNHYKNKSKHLLQQLSFVPKLWNFVYGRGFSWGLKSIRSLVMNPDIYTFVSATVSPLLAGVPENAIDEVEELGPSFLPDVPD